MLTHGFGPIMAIFSTFFRQYWPEKCLLSYSRVEKRLPRLKKQEVKKVEKLTFFRRGEPMVLVQKWPFFDVLFLGNIGQENVFYDILEQKDAFLGYKNKNFKKWKNWHFSKGVNPWFWSKNGYFSIFFLGNVAQKNVFYDIPERKDTFLSYKNKKSKRWKNCNFSNWVNPWFWSKNGHFFNFFF